VSLAKKREMDMVGWVSRLLPSGLTALVTLVTAGAVQAQSAYPEKPVRLVVGFSAGGPTDLPARFVADRLGKVVGQRVLVENRVGAGGQIATQDVLSRPRDGYNLLLCTHFESINTAVYKRVVFKLSDLAPISQISQYYYGVAVTNDLPAPNWDAFVAYAKSKPGMINYGSVGRGSAQEILARELGKLTGIDMTLITYKGGAEIMPDLMAGRIHLYVSPTLSILPQYKAGKLRLIAVTSPERLAAAPEVQTLKEKGLNFVRFGWLGVCAGAGTPQPIITQLNRHITAIVKSPEYREMIEKTGSIAVASTPEELGRVLIETHEQTAGIVREFGLQQE
jgi:tripartite-type tricarboxylate transporter receptor subunit TctC